jgi:ribonuclease BN (tRNA processing enzyme)
MYSECLACIVLLRVQCFDTRSGIRAVVLGDTYDASSLYKIGWDCDLLIHESTFLEEKRDWEAEKMGHSTACEPFSIAFQVSAVSYS